MFYWQFVQISLSLDRLMGTLDLLFCEDVGFALIFSELWVCTDCILRFDNMVRNYWWGSHFILVFYKSSREMHY